MRVENMTSPKSYVKVANQFIITEMVGDNIKKEYFQSYKSMIVFRKTYADGRVLTTLDVNKWDYSRTTSKYRNIFLAETTKETKAKIASGEYVLVDLN